MAEVLLRAAAGGSGSGLSGDGNSGSQGGSDSAGARQRIRPGRVGPGSECSTHPSFWRHAALPPDFLTLWTNLFPVPSREVQVWSPLEGLVLVLTEPQWGLHAATLCEYGAEGPRARGARMGDVGSSWVRTVR